MKNRILLSILLALIVIQFFSVDLTNPTVKYDMIVSDPNVKMILKKACYDCHSNETVWPWYSYVAPVSWLIEDDVKQARKELNFSDFEDYTIKRKIHKLEEMKEEMEDGEMPLDNYTFLHSDAELTDLEKQAVYDWVQLKITQIRELNSDSTIQVN